MSVIRAEVYPENYVNSDGEVVLTMGWFFKVTKKLGGGYTAVSKAGPFSTEKEAVFECGWVKNRMETYED